MEWSLAVPDWEARIRAGRSLMPALPWLDGAEARRAVSIFNKLRLPDVPDQPAFAEAAGDWFREIVAALLGAVDIETMMRAVRELFLLTPKKQSKTTGGAGLMMTALLMNRRPRAEFLLIGPTKMVADLAFQQASGMIEADPDGFLRRRMHVQSHLRTITDRRTKATLQIKAFAGDVLTGVKPAGVLVDELHEISANAKAARIIGQIRGGLVAYPESFLAFITTQSDTPPAGVFRSELMMARAIRDGRARGTMLPILYEFPDAIMKDRGEPPAWENPKNWPMVTPNLGRSVTLERLIDEHATAKLKGEEELRRWASQHLNVEIGVALGSDRWAGADFWERRADGPRTLGELMKRCDVVVAGIDGGGLDDLLGFAAVGRDRVTRDWLLWNKAWAHASVLERRKSEAPRFKDFEAAGELVIVKELGDDIEQVAELVLQISTAGLLPEKDAIGLDPVGIGAVVDALAERGIGGAQVTGNDDQVVGIPQGWKMAGSIKTAERKLADGTMHHAGQRMMDWCVGNAKVEPKGNAIMITKQAAGTAKIDPLVATFNAVALMSMNPKDSPYADGRPILFV